MLPHAITANDLSARIDDPDVVVVDARSAPLDGSGIDFYTASHIPGAVQLRWDVELADPHDSTPGQLAPPRQFAAIVGGAGIGPNTTVVAYDDGRLFAASRLQWAFAHYGFDNVLVLEGGFRAWQTLGGPVSQELPTPDPSPFPEPHSGGLRSTKYDVLRALETAEVQLVDCRLDETYAAAGEHIPGAVHVPSSSVFEASGALKPPAELDRMLDERGVDSEKPTILYCGGGVSATAVFRAFRMAGRTDATVYDGSWAEWSADPDTPRESHKP